MRFFGEFSNLENMRSSRQLVEIEAFGYISKDIGNPLPHSFVGFEILANVSTKMYELFNVPVGPLSWRSIVCP